MNDDEFLPTRRSLLSRLKRWDDQASWQQFFDTYNRLIYRVAIKVGLTDAEAQDVVQETILVVARKIPGFNYDPALGSFKSWLMLITRRRIEKQLKKRMPSVFPPTARPPTQDVQKPPRRGLGPDDTKRTATVERIPDPKGFDLEAAWEAEWETNLWETALARVKAQIKPKQFQMFDLYALKEWPVKDVARALGVSVTHVYVNRHRVARLLKNEMKSAPRQSVKIPGFTTVAVLTLAFSIGLGRSHGAESLATTKGLLGEKAGDETTVVGIRLCWCPPGKFIMGSPRGEPERRPGEDQVEVTLTKGFWMAKFEATQGDWKRVIGKLPGPLTAELPEGDDFPVGNVNFAEAEAFCQKLTELAHQSGELPSDWEFRLPTEAQWEYACRAGTTTATSFGDKLSSKQANFKGKPYNGGEPGPSLNRAAKVGSYPANPWGLHDMHGNIFEWCRDWYHSNLPGGVDPDLYAAQSTAALNRTGDRSRARRGGAWTDDGWPCRSAFRLRFEPHRRYDHIGFRVVAVRS